MLKTHGSNKLLKNFKNIKFTDIKIGLKIFWLLKSMVIKYK